MTNRTYTTGERLAAVMILIGLLGAIAATTVPTTLGDFLAGEDEIAGYRNKLAELTLRQQDLTALAAQRDALLQTDPQPFGLLVAGTLELARAKMQNALQTYSVDAGAAIAQFRAIETADPQKAAAAVDLQITADALPQLLIGITSSEPLLFIDSIDIRSNLRGQTVEGPNTLSVSLVISVFVAIPGEGTKR